VKKEKRLNEAGSAKISGRKNRIVTFIVIRDREANQWLLK
jgi:hypothetical protein